MQQRPQSPQSIGAVLGVGFELFLAGLKRVYPLAFAYALCSGLQDLPQLQVDVEVRPITAPQFAAYVVLGFTQVVMFAAIVTRLDALAGGEDLSTAAVLRTGWRLSPFIILAGILYGLAVLAGLLLLVVPGVIVSVYLGLAFNALILRNLGVVGCLKYSYALVRGHWWRTVAMLLFMLGVVFLLAVLLRLVVTVVGAPADSGSFITEVIAALLLAPLGAYSSAAMLAVFYDLELRRNAGGKGLVEHIDA